MFKDEEAMRDIIISWLEKNGLNAERSILIKTFEIDIGAIGKKKLCEDGFKSSNNLITYAFELKLATTHRLVKEVVEQAIVRLLVADYVYIVVPESAKVWVNNTEMKTMHPPELVKKYLFGPYSKKLGLISVTPSGRIEVIKTASKSGLVINELKSILLNKLPSTSTTFRF